MSGEFIENYFTINHLASLTIITFVNTWNDYMGPFIYLSSTENKTIQLGLKMFVGLFDAEYALIMAASVFLFYQ